MSNLPYIILGSNPFFGAFSQSDWFGKFIFLSLFILSILSWTMLIYKVRLAKALRAQAKFATENFEKSRQNPLNLSFSDKKNPFANIYQRLRSFAIEILQKNGSTYLASADINLIEGHLETGVCEQMRAIEKNLYILPTTVSLAPFLGLLGTVWGILISLGELQHSNSSLVLSGIAMALATTVLGLLVAIPPLIGYNYLRSTLREIRLEMEDFSATALAAVEMQYRKVAT